TGRGVDASRLPPAPVVVHAPRRNVAGAPATLLRAAGRVAQGVKHHHPVSGKSPEVSPTSHPGFARRRACEMLPSWFCPGPWVRISVPHRDRTATMFLLSASVRSVPMRLAMPGRMTAPRKVDTG